MRRIVNYALLLETAHSAAFVGYSHLITATNESDFRLGEESLAHLTIVQFEVSDQDVASVGGRLCELAREPIALELMGLTFLPTKDGHMWVEVQVLKSDRLAVLQREALTIIGNATIHSGVADAYRPHITVARLLNRQQLPSIAVEYEVARRKGVRGRAALGVCGPQFQFVKTIQ